MEDSGEVTVMLVPQDRLDFLDGYTGSKKRKTRGSGKPKKTQCVVCMDADANMSFVHGNTAHFKLATCEACAKKSKSHIWRTPAPLNARCPVCRQGIERIAKRSSRNLGRKGGGVKKGASVEIP